MNREVRFTGDSRAVEAIAKSFGIFRSINHQAQVLFITLQPYTLHDFLKTLRAQGISCGVR